MKRTLRTLGFLAALALPATLTAQASSEKSVGFGVSGGLSMPSGQFGDRFDAGYNVAGHVFYKTAALKAIRLRGDVSFDSWNGSTDGLEANSLGFSGNALIDLGVSNASSVHAYLLGGGGMLSIRSIERNLGNGDFERRSNELGLQIGGGLQFNLTGFKTFAEARLVRAFTDVRSSNWIVVSFGVSP